LDGELRVEHLARADLERCWELMDQYADSALGLVDASIIALAERLRITRVLTLDSGISASCGHGTMQRLRLCRE
jgi:predicted nucleic acid-binding protein